MGGSTAQAGFTVSSKPLLVAAVRLHLTVDRDPLSDLKNLSLHPLLLPLVTLCDGTNSNEPNTVPCPPLPLSSVVDLHVHTTLVGPIGGNVPVGVGVGQSYSRPAL